MKNITYNETSFLYTCECGAQLEADDLTYHLESNCGQADCGQAGVPIMFCQPVWGYSAEKLNEAIINMRTKLRESDPFSSSARLR